MPRTAAHQSGLQRISAIPSTYNDLKDTVLYCQRHFEDVLKDARVVFTSERAGKVLDEWMDLVVKSAGEIRNFYAKSSLGESTFWCS